MIKKLLQAAVVVAGGLALGGCPLGQQAKTTAPANKPPAADYQVASTVAPPPAASVRAICYNDADLATYNGRMVQQQFVVATLQCQNPGGARAFESSYASFLSKFQGELATNARGMQSMAGRKRFNVDAVVTEFANRTAQRVQVDKEFCARSKRAFDWALSPKVSSLTQVPPLYDLGPDMNVWPCPAP